jgi:hypothetical protein
MNSQADNKFSVVKRKNSLRISNSLFFCEFKKSSGGFPSVLGFSGRAKPVVETSSPWMQMTRDGTQTIIPSLTSFAPEISHLDGGLRVHFEKIRWQTAEGLAIDDVRMDLMYEIYEDGAVFVTTWFFTDTLKPGKLTDLLLQPTLQLDTDDDANWAYWKLPRQQMIEGKMIQDFGSFERNLSKGEQRQADMIYPFVSFDFGRDGRRDHHCEFFVESWNALSLDPDNTSTDVSWRKQNVVISWNFETRERHLANPEKHLRGVVDQLPYQWRNVWGWCLRRFPVERSRPPFRVPRRNQAGGGRGGQSFHHA